MMIQSPVEGSGWTPTEVRHWDQCCNICICGQWCEQFLNLYS